MTDSDYWAARDERVTREILAVCAAIGADKFGRIKVFAIPQEPDDEHPEDREYYVETDVLTHGPTINGGAMVNGTEKRVYRIVLEPTEDVSAPVEDEDSVDEDGRPDVWHITAGRTPDGVEHVLCGIPVTWTYDNMTPKNPDTFCARCVELDG